MKKILFIVFMMIGIVGCNCNKKEKIKLEVENIAKENESSTYLYSNYGLLSKELKDISDYDNKIINKDSFLLFVYAEGCYGCSLLAPALREYVNENDVTVYTLDYANVNDKHDLYKAGVNTTPHLVLVENGIIKHVKLVKLSDDKTKNIEWTKKWIDSNIEWRNA